MFFIKKLRLALYLGAALFIIVPTTIVLISEYPFSNVFSNTLISVAIIMVILGKTLTVFEKKKENKSFISDLGAIVGLFIVFILRLV